MILGGVKKLLSNHDVEIRRGNVNIHRDKGIVERFNRTYTERLFGHRYAEEMKLSSNKRSTEWVRR